MKALIDLFLPPECAVCGKPLAGSGYSICPRCMADIPLTGFHNKADNPVAEMFWGQLPLANACSMIWFMQQSGYRDALHLLKYRGRWRLAYTLGRWFGRIMEEGGLYGEVDLIIAVPLHPFRIFKRGYNQSEYIAMGIAEELNKPVVRSAVRRHKHNPHQARKPREERWENVSGIFSVCDVKRLQGRHILLVDDVLTTGATILSCAETIVAAVPDCRISIATLSVSKSEISRRNLRVRRDY